MVDVNSVPTAPAIGEECVVASMIRRYSADESEVRHEVRLKEARLTALSDVTRGRHASNS